jgi:glycosyltransferase involved in cell wall biosynthesis
MRRVTLFSSVADTGFNRALILEWQKAGLNAELVGAVREKLYRQNARDFLGRLRRRWQMYAGYLWTVWRRLRTEGTDGRVRIVTTNPFFLPAFVQSLSSRKAVNVCLVYDLFPDVMVLNKSVGADGWVHSLLAALTRYSFRNSAATVFLGARLRHYAEGQYGVPKRTAVIPVGADGRPFREFTPIAIADDAIKTILYAGHMGRMHDISTILHLWREKTHSKINWRFHASGEGYRELCRESGDVRVKHGILFGQPLSDDEWAGALKECPIALVTLKAGAENLVMPSKAYSAMVAGQAILGICAVDSDLAEMIRTHDCGWVVEPGNIAKLNDTLDEIAAASESLQMRRLNSFRAGHRLYSSEVVARAWGELFMDLSDDGVASR